MKILWFPRFQFDIEKFRIGTRENMCRALERMGHSVEIAIAGDQGDLVDMFDRKFIKIPIIKIKFLRIVTFYLLGFVQFWRSYRRIRPDLVIVDIYSVWFVIPLVGMRRRRVLIVMDNRTPFYDEVGESKPSFSSQVMKLYTSAAFHFSRKFLDGITVITDHYKDLVVARFHLNPARVGVWGSGVDPMALDPNRYRDPNRLECMQGKFAVLQHGDMTFNRGLLETLEAFALLKQEDIVLVLVGDGVAKQHIADAVERLRVSSRVFLFDPIPSTAIPNLIASADCAVMAYPDIEYWNNNNPLKLLEYLAMEKVVICTDMWTFRQVCGYSPSAFYIQDNSPTSIAAAIMACFEDRHQLPVRGSGGSRIVRERFSWDAQSNRLTAFVESLVR